MILSLDGTPLFPVNAVGPWEQWYDVARHRAQWFRGTERFHAANQRKTNAPQPGQRNGSRFRAFGLSCGENGFGLTTAIYVARKSC